MNFRIDNLQYCNWNEDIFRINRQAKLDAVHVTIAYHEDYDEVQKNINEWNSHFEEFNALIFHGRSYKDIELMRKIRQQFSLVFKTVHL